MPGAAGATSAAPSSTPSPPKAVRGRPVMADVINRPGELRRRVLTLYAGLIPANLAAWAYALVLLHSHPLLLGTAALAYGFGLRHAIDADHIAAIDNVTRKLMQEGRRPVGVGFFFSLGHSTVVIALSVAIA